MTKASNTTECLTAAICKDPCGKIYRDRENLGYWKRSQITMNGPKLGKPLKSHDLYKEQYKQEKSEAKEGQ